MQTTTILAYVQRARPAGMRPRRIIVHDPGQPADKLGVPEPVSAVGVANFNGLPPAQRNPPGVGGYHRLGDQNYFVQCAPDTNRVNGAAEANDDGLHYCLGDYSDEALSMFAMQCHAWNHLYDIPLVRRGVADWNQPGILEHLIVEKAIRAESPHTDARLFPWDRFWDFVNLATPTSEVDVTTLALPSSGHTPRGRNASARAVPALGVVVLENGGRLDGDKPNGKTFVWRHPAVPANAKLLDIIDLRPLGLHQIAAQYDIGDPSGPGTYATDILPHY